LFELKACKQCYHDVRIALPQVESLITIEYDQFTRVEAVVEEVLNLHMHEMDVREGEFGLFHARLNTR
jgi:putative ubiquitin-RnfH superfamily antitoxin RatB of RatAB toxin-antitoxin module